MSSLSRDSSIPPPPAFLGMACFSPCRRRARFCERRLFPKNHFQAQPIAIIRAACRTICALAEQVYQRRNREIERLKTPEAIRARQRWARETFWKLVGGELELTPLGAQKDGERTADVAVSDKGELQRIIVAGGRPSRRQRRTPGSGALTRSPQSRRFFKELSGRYTPIPCKFLPVYPR